MHNCRGRYASLHVLEFVITDKADLESDRGANHFSGSAFSDPFECAMRRECFNYWVLQSLRLNITQLDGFIRYSRDLIGPSSELSGCQEIGNPPVFCPAVLDAITHGPIDEWAVAQSGTSAERMGIAGLVLADWDDWMEASINVTAHLFSGHGSDRPWTVCIGSEPSDMAVLWEVNHELCNVPEIEQCDERCLAGRQFKQISFIVDIRRRFDMMAEMIRASAPDLVHEDGFIHLPGNGLVWR